MSPRRWLLPGLLLVALRYTAAPAAPADDGSAELARAESLRNVRLVCQARRVLSRDAVLAPFNLGVSVHDDVAVVWGFVPSPAARRRAVEALRQVPGVLEVRSELQVLAPVDFLTECLNGPSVPFATPLPSLPATLAAPAQLTSRWTELNAVPLPGDGPSGVLLMPSLLAPMPEAATTSDLAATVEKLRRSDARFRDVRAEVRGGIVRLSGQVARAEDGMALAQQIARLPGVERVLLQDVRSAPQ